MKLLALPVIAEIENIYNNFANASKARSYMSRTRKTIIYVVKNLADHGGVETRLHAYASELKALDYNVIFVSENNYNDSIKREHQCIHLNFHARNFIGSLVRIAVDCGADVVEFQIKNKKYICPAYIEALRKVCRTGCLVHGELPGIDMSILNLLDYRIFISGRLCTIGYERLGPYLVLPNAIDVRHNAVWKYRGQKRALIVSRVRRDKYNQLKSAIEFCLSRGIPFTVTGSPGEGGTAARLRREFGLPDDAFTHGAIDTIEYLRCNSHTYLFVAGVGQVLLEAGLSGYPCLIASDLGAPFCSFLTRDNILREDVFGQNLTLNHAKKNLKDVQVTEITDSRMADYDISEVIRDRFSLKRRIREYVSYIDAAENESADMSDEEKITI